MTNTDIYLRDYQHVLELKVGVKRYVKFSNCLQLPANEKRYHQSLDYQTPEQVFFSDLIKQSGQGVKVA